MWAGEDPVDAGSWLGAAARFGGPASVSGVQPRLGRKLAEWRAVVVEVSGHDDAVSSSGHRLDRSSLDCEGAGSPSLLLRIAACVGGVVDVHYVDHATGVAVLEPGGRHPSPVAVEVRDREPAAGDELPAVAAPDDGVLGVGGWVEDRVPRAGEPGERPMLRCLELLQTGHVHVMLLEEPHQPPGPGWARGHARVVADRGGVAGTEGVERRDG